MNGLNTFITQWSFPLYQTLGTAFLILAAFFGIMGAMRMQTTSVILSGAILGGALAFLIFNYHPARLFMGDTGSLFFGAILAGSAFLLGEPLLILTAGMLYVLEGTSVILQVLFFRLTKGKRLFKMAPLHHHFEKSGWSEVRIVSVFSLVTFLFCFLSYKSIF
jgi:phospho-N-acetylmuramoyl-pentapeptide-transferase